MQWVGGRDESLYIHFVTGYSTPGKTKGKFLRKENSHIFDKVRVCRVGNYGKSLQEEQHEITVISKPEALKRNTLAFI